MHISGWFKMRIMHIFGRCAFQHNKIPTASLSQNCVGIIKDNSDVTIPLIPFSKGGEHFSALFCNNT